MTVGSIVLATDQGLGYLARDFFQNGIIHKVLIHRHTTRKNHFDWYPSEAIVRTWEDLLEACDSFLFFEEVFDWKLIPAARAARKKTVLMPMYECTRNPLPYQPDLILSPSLLDQKYFDSTLVKVPVPAHVPWRQRGRARVFVHNAGNGGLGGRNGTKELLEAMQYVQSPLKLIVRSQVAILGASVDPRIEYRFGTVSPENLWDEGDVFVFPEKFNGLSLPLQEAYAAGMLVMCGDRFPMNRWLPREPLIPVQRYKKERIAVEFDSAVFDPITIAATMDAWYGKNIAAFSRRGKIWGQIHSWQNLKGTYEAHLSA